MTLRTDDGETGSVTVGGIFDNHIYDYIVLSAETYEGLFEACGDNALMLRTSGDPEETAKALTEIEPITSVSQLSVMEHNITDALGCLWGGCSIWR